MKKKCFVVLISFMTLTIYSQNFTETVLFANHYGREAEWGDYDRDGDLDILIFYTVPDNTGTPFTRILKNNNGNFQILDFNFPIVENFGSAAYGSANFVDYDNDGFLDVFLTFGGPFNSEIFLFRNNGNDSFNEITLNIVPPTVGSCSTSWIDYDNDGDLDLTLFGWEYNPFPNRDWTIRIYENKLETNEFIDTQIDFHNSILKSRSPWADFNNDGYMDLLTNEPDATCCQTKLCIYKNNGNKTFTKLIYNNIAGLGDDVLNQNGDMRWGDYDNDGYVDILFAGRQTDAATKLYKNNGDETFTEIDISNVIQLRDHVNLEWGDYNNDGTLDILQTGTNQTNGVTNVTRVFFNVNNSFSSTDFESFLGVHQYAMSTAGDYNGDNKLDILNLGSFGFNNNRKISLFENSTSNTNSSPTIPQSLNVVLIGDELVFSWSQSNDDLTPTNSLTYNISIYSSNNQLVSPNALDNGKRLIVGTGNTGYNDSYKLKIPDDGNYFWKVQAIDNSYTGSAFSNVHQFTLNNQTLSTNEFIKKPFTISPNPVNHELILKTNSNQTLNYIKVYDIKGVLVKQININESHPEFLINTSDLQSGFYLLKINGVNTTQTIKFIKN